MAHAVPDGDDEQVLTAETARALRDAGLTWEPSSGDRFVVTAPEMGDQVFVVSEMVIEHSQGPGGGVLRFNGTTEWALDQVLVEESLWLPREDQLREALGASFVALARTSPQEWVVTTVDGSTFAAPDAEEAYASALAARLG